jgi:phage/plasmid-associated DNA primase
MSYMEWLTYEETRQKRRTNPLKGDSLSGLMEYLEYARLAYMTNRPDVYKVLQFWEWLDVAMVELKLIVNWKNHDRLGAISEFLLTYLKCYSTGSNLYVFDGTKYLCADEGQTAIKKLVRFIHGLTLPDKIKKGYKDTDGKEVWQQLLLIAPSPVGVVNELQGEWIPFKNGMYNLLTGRLYSYEKLTQEETDQPLPVWTYTLNSEYKPDASFEDIQKFFEECLPGVEDRRLVMGYLYYLLTGRTDLQKVILFQGKGGNGKSVVIGLLEELFQGFVTSVFIQDFKEKFVAYDFTTCLVNLGADLPEMSIKDLGVFMQSTGDGFLSVRKLYQNPELRRILCRHIFSCNIIPSPPPNVGDAWWRRWIVVVFSEQFLGEDANLELLDQLKGNMPGFVNYILSHADCVTDLIQFDMKKAAKLWKEYGDSVVRFFLACQTSGFTRCETLYSEYKDFCTQRHLNFVNPVWFGRKLGDLGVAKRRDNSSFSGQLEWVYDDVTYVPPPPKQGALPIKR